MDGDLGITLFAVPLIILGPTGGRLAQRVGPFRIACVGLVAGAFFIFVYGQVPSGTWIFGFAMFHAITDALTISASGVAVAMSVPEERQAGAQGLIGAAQALTGGITAGVIGIYNRPAGRRPTGRFGCDAPRHRWRDVAGCRHEPGHELHADSNSADGERLPRLQARRPSFGPLIPAEGHDQLNIPCSIHTGRYCVPSDWLC